MISRKKINEMLQWALQWAPFCGVGLSWTGDYAIGLGNQGPLRHFVHFTFMSSFLLNSLSFIFMLPHMNSGSACKKCKTVCYIGIMSLATHQNQFLSRLISCCTDHTHGSSFSYSNTPSTPPPFMISEIYLSGHQISVDHVFFY